LDFINSLGAATFFSLLHYNAFPLSYSSCYNYLVLLD
jgi:hypothetical protein